MNSRRPWPAPACRRTRAAQTDGAPGWAAARPVQATAAAYVDPQDFGGKVQDGEPCGYPLLWVVRGDNVVMMVVE